MRLFLDTANIDEIIAGKELGIIEGVTTNPSLIARETGQSFKEAIEQITGLIPGPVSAEVISTEAQGMVEEARGLAAISDNVVIKVPITGEGLKATCQLAKENIQVNMTLIFFPIRPSWPPGLEPDSSAPLSAGWTILEKTGLD